MAISAARKRAERLTTFAEELKTKSPHEVGSACTCMYLRLCNSFHEAARNHATLPEIQQFLSAVVPDSALEAMVTKIVPADPHSIFSLRLLESFDPFKPKPDSLEEVSIATLMNRVAKLTGQDLLGLVSDYNTDASHRNQGLGIYVNALSTDTARTLTSYTPPRHDNLQNYLISAIQDFRSRHP